VSNNRFGVFLAGNVDIIRRFIVSGGQVVGRAEFGNKTGFQEQTFRFRTDFNMFQTTDIADQLSCLEAKLLRGAEIRRYPIF